MLEKSARITCRILGKSTSFWCVFLRRVAPSTPPVSRRKMRYLSVIQMKRAVREGFEPSVPFRVRRFSKAVLSTTQPPHQNGIGSKPDEHRGVKRKSAHLRSRGVIGKWDRDRQGAFRGGPMFHRPRRVCHPAPLSVGRASGANAHRRTSGVAGGTPALPMASAARAWPALSITPSLPDGGPRNRERRRPAFFLPSRMAHRRAGSLLSPG